MSTIVVTDEASVDEAVGRSEVVFVVADRVRAEFFRRVGLEDLLAPVASL